MKELDLQGEYVMDFICRRDDGLCYREVKNTSINNEMFIPSDLEEFISENSPQAWKRLVKKFSTLRELLNALMDELKKRLMEATNVAIFLNKNRNITFEGESIRLFNVSGTELSEDDEFKKNIFSAVEEVPYIFKHNGETQFSIRPDISFFVNGILFGYAELKSNFNNQNARENGRKKVVYDYLDAFKSYLALSTENDENQSLRRQMLRFFEKNIHITSTDIHEVYVIRDLTRYFDDFKKGFTDINIDLMYGIQDQTLTDWEKTLDTVLNFNSSHISLYPLTIEKGTKFYLQKTETNPELQRAMYETACIKFKNNNLSHYEISNWARDKKYSKHNKTYWQNNEYVGLGAAAASYYKRYRFKNNINVNEYINSILGGKDACIEKEYINDAVYNTETIMLGLRLSEGVHIKYFNDKKHIIDKYLKD